MWVCVCFCEPILSIFNEFHCQLCIQLCWPRPGLLKVRTPVRIRTGGEFNPDQRPPDISCARVSLRPPCGARGTHTHTHTHGCMNQCCRDYRLFCKTKHIATSEILDKPQISFSRIMSPVSPRKREAQAPPSFSTSRVSSIFKEPNRSRLLNEQVQNSVSKNLSLLTVWHMNMDVVLLQRVEICT